MFMNEYDIDIAVQRHARHPVLGPAARFLDAFKDEVNAHSDGWPYWRLPAQAAKRLMTLIQKGDGSEAELRAALAPIKSFMTRRGTAAGMAMPPLQ